MAIIDLDKLILDTQKFIFQQKEYEIKPITYRQTIEMSKLEKQIETEDDPEKLLNLQADYIHLVIPEMDRETILNTNMVQSRKIQELISEVLSGEKANDEVEYYRNKYKDEYRKNLERVGESSD